MEFANKEYFALLLLLVPYVVWFLLFRKKSEPTMRVSSTEAYALHRRAGVKGLCICR